MELRHLRYFVAVAEEESVARAAARLHVSAPPLSRQVRDLENDLGVDLLERGAKSVRVTEAGRAFLEEARSVLRRADQAMQVARMVAERGRGEIDVGFAPSLTVEILPRTLRILHGACPGVRVRLHDLSTEQMLSGLRDRELHAAMMIQPPRTMMKGLAFERLRNFAVWVAMQPDHPLAGARRVGLAQVANEPLVVYGRREYPEYHAWMNRLFARVKTAPRIAEEHEGSTGLIASVESGRGVALVQEGFDRLAGRRLKIIPLAPAPPPFVVGVACRREPPQAATAQFFAAARQAAIESA